MKKLLAFLMFVSLSAMANEVVPSYLKDGVITVTLKNGKQYTYSANEYFIAKRGSKSPKLELAEQENKGLKEELVVEKKRYDDKPQRLKHIVSGEVVHSNRGLETTNSGNEVDIKSRKQIGVGMQYQYNVYKDLYLGGRVDTNGGTGVQLGVGF